MANTFVSIKEIARQALPRLIDNLVFPNLVHKDFSNDFEVGKGATIQIRKPVTLTASEFSGSVTAQDVAESTVEVTLNKLATVDVAFGAIERATSVDDVNRLFIEPAAVALAEKINNDGLALLKEITAFAHVDPMSLEPFSIGAMILNKAKVPLSPRYGVWSPDAEADFRTIPAIVNAEKSGSTAALRTGAIGNIFGIQNYMAQGVDSDNMLGCVFHPFAFAFVTRPLQQPSGVESYTTSYNGITLRVTKGYDMKTKTEMLSMDVLYGYKTLDKNLAVKLTAAGGGIGGGA
jgi:hypothetical protein